MLLVLGLLGSKTREGTNDQNRAPACTAAILPDSCLDSRPWQDLRVTQDDTRNLIAHDAILPAAAQWHLDGTSGSPAP